MVRRHARRVGLTRSSSQLLEAEVLARRDSALGRLLRQARFPDIKTFEQLDWDALASSGHSSKWFSRALQEGQHSSLRAHRAPAAVRRVPQRRRSGCRSSTATSAGSRGLSRGRAGSRWSARRSDVDAGVSVHAVRGDARQLFHVEVQQITGSGVLVAQLLPAHAMQEVEAVETAAPEHGVDGGTGEPERPGDAVRPEPRAAAHGADAPLQLGCGAPGVTVRRRAAVLEPIRSRLSEAPHPLRDRWARDPEAPGDLRLGPAGLHLQNQLQPGDRRQTRVTMCHERLLPCYWCLLHTQQQAGPLTCNNLRGNYI